MTKETFINSVRSEIESARSRTYWERGVNDYASRFADDLEEWLDGNYIELDDLRNLNRLEKILLNGANDWNHYSWSGCSLCYNSQIAEQLCTPSELKKTRNGERQPNKYEDWLDVQARALRQAYLLVQRAVRNTWNRMSEPEPQSEEIKKLSRMLGKMLLPRH